MLRSIKFQILFWRLHLTSFQTHKCQQTEIADPADQPLRPTLSQFVNSLWLSDAIWGNRSGSTLACCPPAQSHYLIQCWLLLKGVLSVKLVPDEYHRTPLMIMIRWQVRIDSGNGSMPSVANSHRSASLRLITLEKREHFVDFSSILCLWFEIHGMMTNNFFDWVSNTVDAIRHSLCSSNKI